VLYLKWNQNFFSVLCKNFSKVIINPPTQPKGRATATRRVRDSRVAEGNRRNNNLSNPAFF